MAKAEEQFKTGLSQYKQGNMERAMKSFEAAYNEDKTNASYMSYYGACLALVSKDVPVALEYCTRAIKKEFYRADFYVNLGRVYLVAGNKKGAIKVLLKGLKADQNNKEINDMLVELGFRAKPIVPGLGRGNPVNKYLGILCRRILPGMLKKQG